MGAGACRKGGVDESMDAAAGQERVRRLFYLFGFGARPRTHRPHARPRQSDETGSVLLVQLRGRQLRGGGLEGLVAEYYRLAEASGNRTYRWQGGSSDKEGSGICVGFRFLRMDYASSYISETLPRDDAPDVSHALGYLVILQMMAVVTFDIGKGG